MNYDIESNILNWELGSGKIVKVLELGNFIIHLSGAGKPVLIEILNASSFKTNLNNSKFLKEMSEAI